MSGNGFGSDDLQRRFREPPEGAAAAGDCPEAERILQAVLGELTAAENRAVADHAAVCPSCTVAWRLAREYASEAGLEEKAAPRRVAPVLRWLPAAAAIAAVVALAAFLVPWDRRKPAGPPVMRTLEHRTIESLLTDGAAMPAERFTLRWSPGPEGSRYAVRVTDRRLEHIAGAASLDRPEFTVPESSLAVLEPGALILWQVETTLPDGRRLVSETFSARLE